MVDHKKFAHHRTSLCWVDPREIHVHPGLNARDLSTPENKAHVEWIANSIEKNGFRPAEPLELAEIDGKVVVTHGHCRLAAVMLCIERGVPIEFVPYIPEPPGTSAEDRIHNQYVDNNGKRLSPLELGFNAKRLMGMGTTVQTIAERWAVSDTYVGELLRLQAAPIEVRNMVAAGEVSAGAALEVMREEGVEEGATVLRETLAEAKAQGKTKVTPKALKTRAAANDQAKAVRILFRPKTRLLSVRIAGTDINLPPERWLEVAERIAAEARPFVDRGEQTRAPHEEPMPKTVAAE